MKTVAPSFPTVDIFDAIADAIASRVATRLATLAAEAPSQADRGDLLTRDQLCTKLHISKPTLTRRMREGLPYVSIGESPRFDLPKVMEWLEAQPRRPLAPARVPATEAGPVRLISKAGAR